MASLSQHNSWNLVRTPMEIPKVWTKCTVIAKVFDPIWEVSAQTGWPQQQRLKYDIRVGQDPKMDPHTTQI